MWPVEMAGWKRRGGWRRGRRRGRGVVRSRTHYVGPASPWILAKEPETPCIVQHRALFNTRPVGRCRHNNGAVTALEAHGRHCAIRRAKRGLLTSLCAAARCAPENVPGAARSGWRTSPSPSPEAALSFRRELQQQPMATARPLPTGHRVQGEPPPHKEQQHATPLPRREAPAANALSNSRSAR